MLSFHILLEMQKNTKSFRFVLIHPNFTNLKDLLAQS